MRTKFNFIALLLVVSMLILLPLGVHAEGTEENVGTEGTEENVGTEGSEDLGFEPVTDLKWSDTTQGVITFTNANTENLYYQITLFKDDEWFAAERYKEVFAQNNLEFDMRRYLNESGSYTATVSIYRNDEDCNDPSKKVETTTAAAYVYNKPEIALSKPQSVTWSTTQLGTITWSSVVNAEQYLLYLYKLDESGNYQEYWKFSRIYINNDEECKYDLFQYLSENNKYKVQVVAISGDVNNYANSELSDFSDELSTMVANENTKNKLEELMTPITQNATQDQINNVVEEIKTNFADNKKSDLAIGMQTDEDIYNMIKNAENAYGIAVNKDISPETGINSNAVQVVGAALNADAGNTVTVSMKKPEEQSKIAVDSSHYKNAVQFSIKLEIGETPKDELDIPITITMPIPGGIEPSKLEILHYTANQTYETIHPRINGNGTCTFTITHFSEFIFAEALEANKATQYVGVSEESGPEFWQPSTPEDIYRYNLLGHDNNTYVVKEGLPYNVSIRNEVQGELFFNSIHTIAKNYELVRTYNFLPNNKRQYTMKEKATITFTIPKLLQKDGRNWVLFGVKEDGTPYILKDLDKNSDTITVTTNAFYAFALGYKAK